LQYSYGFLYRFEGDFLYSAILDIPCDRTGILNISLFIKPWILNELYWQIQQMDMEKMRAQPKSLHVTGAFTINDIFYKLESVEYDKENFGQTIRAGLVRFNANIEENKKRLTGIDVICDDIVGYRLSNLTKAIALIYSHDYDNALRLLLKEDNVKDAYVHIDSKGKTAKDYAIEFCRERMGMK
jgi:hypothetical protein